MNAAVEAPAVARPLVIGYGNPLRADDGVGWQVAHRLADDPRAAGVDVIATHQLSPEHAADLATASRVVLVDAQVAPACGLEAPRPGECLLSGIAQATGTPPGRWTHHRSPEALVAMAHELFGAAPPVLVVGVGVGSVEGAEHLTAPVAETVPALVELALALATDPYPGLRPRTATTSLHQRRELRDA